MPIKWQKTTVLKLSIGYALKIFTSLDLGANIGPGNIADVLGDT